MIVKICGLRTLPAATAAVEGGADLLGFNFVPSSHRCISPETARDIIGELPGHVQTVGIFVNPTVAQVQATVQCSGLDWVQLSGTETPAFCAEVVQPVIKTVRLSERPPAGEARPDDYDVDLLLADAAVPGSWGGSGEVSDWPAAGRLARRRRLLLAGGLHAGNVAAAIRTVRPAGVDVASGIETDGREDPAKIRAFIAAARAAG